MEGTTFAGAPKVRNEAWGRNPPMPERVQFRSELYFKIPSCDPNILNRSPQDELFVTLG
jgi:hypothetical protein